MTINWRAAIIASIVMVPIISVMYLFWRYTATAVWLFLWGIIAVTLTFGLLNIWMNVYTFLAKETKQ